MNGHACAGQRNHDISDGMLGFLHPRLQSRMLLWDEGARLGVSRLHKVFECRGDFARQLLALTDLSLVFSDTVNQLTMELFCPGLLRQCLLSQAFTTRHTVSDTESPTWRNDLEVFLVPGPNGIQEVRVAPTLVSHDLRFRHRATNFGIVGACSHTLVNLAGLHGVSRGTSRSHCSFGKLFENRLHLSEDRSHARGH